jgi:hypothetical protein
MLGPKTPITRSEPYRRYVVSLPCYRCGIEGYSQAAHADAGKGMGIKTDDLTCFPLCGPRPPDQIGCHEIVGRYYVKNSRRAYEKAGSAWAQDRLIMLSGDDKKLRAVLVKVGLVK